MVYFWSTLRVLPKCYRTNHPTSPWLVVYTDPAERDRNGGLRRLRRQFKDEGAARNYHRALLKSAASIGTSGLGLDARARADFYAARTTLDNAGLFDVSVTEALRDFVRARPVPAKSTQTVDELIARFTTAKEVEENASANTVRNLRRRVSAWILREQIVTLADITEDSLLALKQRKAVSARTKINDMAAVSSFLSWLRERRLRADNELLEMSRPKTDGRIPKLLRPNQVSALLTAADEVSDGRLLRYFTLLLLAGLRPSEAAQIEPDQVRLNAAPPFVRVLRGKKRNRPRPAPVLANFPAWWTHRPWPVDAEGNNLPLFRPTSRIDLDTFDAVRERAGLIERTRNEATRKRVLVRSDWQEDICRHTWISVRMQQTKDEARVAYEAGTSVDMIHGHYLDTLDDAAVRAIEAIRPDKKSTAQSNLSSALPKNDD